MKIEALKNITFEKSQSSLKEKTQLPSRSVGYSLYNSTCPIGANYYSPSFGLNNPQAALERAKGLKALYAKQGVKYLLPDEVFSNKKIFEMVETAGQKFSELLSQNKLSKRALNKELKTIIPVSDKIEIRDMKDLRKDLEREGYRSEDIECVTQNVGLTMFGPKKTLIYVAMNDFENRFQEVDAKVTFMHELKHALSEKCNNINNNLNYKGTLLEQDTVIDEKSFYSTMFMNFERKFGRELSGKPVNLDKETLYKKTGCRSANTLQKRFEKAINEEIKNKIDSSKTGIYAVDSLIDYGFVSEKTLNKLAPDGVLTDEVLQKICKNNPKELKRLKSIVKAHSLSDNAFSSKYFWETMAQKARDEKEAYKTESVFRELTGNLNQPLDFELTSLMYGEMEKFFKQKAKNATH